MTPWPFITIAIIWAIVGLDGSEDFYDYFWWLLLGVPVIGASFLITWAVMSWG